MKRLASVKSSAPQIPKPGASEDLQKRVPRKYLPELDRCRRLDFADRNLGPRSLFGRDRRLVVHSSERVHTST